MTLLTVSDLLKGDDSLTIIISFLNSYIDRAAVFNGLLDFETYICCKCEEDNKDKIL